MAIGVFRSLLRYFHPMEEYTYCVTECNGGDFSITYTEMVHLLPTTQLFLLRVRSL